MTNYNISYCKSRLNYFSNYKLLKMTWKIQRKLQYELLIDARKELITGHNIRISENF